MRRQLCLLFLVSLSVVLVQSESTVEVDENGDEYDVKRFNIQGRQLNEGRSQCVEVRRKRAAPAQPQPIYNDDPSNDEMIDKDNKPDAVGDEENEQPMMIFYAPPVMSSAADGEEDEEEKEEENNDMKETNEDNENGEEVTISYSDNNNNTKMEDIRDEKPNLDVKEKDKKDTIKVIKLPKLPILGQIQSDSGVSAASVEEADTDTGILVIQSHKPPKVNPQTHAVFEIIPVNEQVNKADKTEVVNEDNNALSGESDFDFNEELSPITTTAIWSTGDDNSFDRDDEEDKKPVKKVKNSKKPNKNNKNKHQTAVKTKRRNTYTNGLRQGLATENNNYNRNKKRPNKTNNNKRPQKANKKQKGNINRRRYSNRNKQNMKRKQNRNKIIRNSLASNRYQNFNNRNRLITKRNKNRKNSAVVDNGDQTITRTYTWTKTGDEDDDKNVNCIIIRKDPPPTTQRPFWNLWGRSANGAPQASGEFGKRKRVNLRFVAER